MGGDLVDGIAVSVTMAENAGSLILNAKDRDTYDSPIARNLRVTASLFAALMGSLITVSVFVM